MLSLGSGDCVFKFRKLSVDMLIMVIESVSVFCIISILVMLGSIEWIKSCYLLVLFNLDVIIYFFFILVCIKFFVWCINCGISVRVIVYMLLIRLVFNIVMIIIVISSVGMVISVSSKWLMIFEWIFCSMLVKVLRLMLINMVSIIVMNVEFSVMWYL